jgi:hypothetical protein
VLFQHKVWLARSREVAIKHCVISTQRMVSAIVREVAIKHCVISTQRMVSAIERDCDTGKSVKTRFSSDSLPDLGS